MRVKLGDSIVGQDVVHIPQCPPLWGPFTVMVANGTVADGDRYPANVLSVTERALVYRIDTVLLPNPGGNLSN